MLSAAKHLCISAVVLTACSVVAQEPFHTCSTQISADRGTPTLIPHDGPLNWGLSTKPVAKDEPLIVLLWIENPTSQLQHVNTCTDIDSFWLYGIDILDAQGNRVKRRGEKHEPQESDGIFCFRTARIDIQPYSCRTTTFQQHEHDFSTDLLTDYDLPAGKYKIVPKKQHDAAGLEIEVTPR